MSYSVLLHDGTYDGETVDVDDPWPRYSTFPVAIDDGPEEFYLPRETDPPYHADYVDVDTLPPDPADTTAEGEPGPTGPTGVEGSPGPQGEQGEPGTSVALEGAWDIDTTYEYAAIVTHDGSSWISTMSLNVGHEPTIDTGDPDSAYWTLLTVGVEGPEGPAGPPGASVNLFDYMFATTTTEPPTGTSVRLNHATASSATKMWVTHETYDGIDVEIVLGFIFTNDRLTLQDRDDSAKIQRFQVTGSPVQKTGYIEYPITWLSGGSALTAQRIMLAVLRAGAPGPPGDDGEGVPAGGTTGQVLTKDTGTDYDTSWTTPAAGGGGGGARVFTDDFSADTSADWVNPSGDGSNPSVITGGLLTPTTQANGSVRRWYTPTRGQLCRFVKAKFKVGNTGVGHIGVVIGSGAGDHGNAIFFRWQNDGNLVAYHYAGGGFIGTLATASGSQNWTANTYAWVCLWYQPASTATSSGYVATYTTDPDASANPPPPPRAQLTFAPPRAFWVDYVVGFHFEAPNSADWVNWGVDHFVAG